MGTVCVCVCFVGLLACCFWLSLILAAPSRRWKCKEHVSLLLCLCPFSLWAWEVDASQARGCLPHPPLPGEYLAEEEWGLKGPVSVSSLTQESCFMKD